jgi:hypothetical protein
MTHEERTKYPEIVEAFGPRYPGITYKDVPEEQKEGWEWFKLMKVIV